MTGLVNIEGESLQENSIEKVPSSGFLALLQHKRVSLCLSTAVCLTMVLRVHRQTEQVRALPVFN